MEQLLFLALLAVVGLLRWFSQMAEERKNREAEKRTGPPPPNTPIQRAPAETEEERIRRFMEALGVPSAPAAPPPVERRRAPAPPQEPPRPTRKTLPVDPFPAPRGGLPMPPVVVAAPAPPPLPQQPPLVPPPPLVPRAPAAPATPRLPTSETTILADPATVRSAADFEVRDIDELAEEASRVAVARGRKAGPAQPTVVAPTTIAARLATAQGLRDAMVLREIFGPPRSMQPLDPHRPEMV